MLAINSQVKNIITQVGDFQKNQQLNLASISISDKGLNQLVSKIDIESERKLVSAFKDIIPNSGFITEENTENTNKSEEFVWIIDPLDGTTNYLHGLPIYSISVALYQNMQPLMAWVYAPALNEFFEATTGKGAFLKNNPIQVSNIANLNQSLVATGFPYYNFNNMDNYIATLSYFMQNTHGLRRMGSAAIDLAYVACGRFDSFYELNLSPWDVAAGALIVNEANGLVTDFKQQNDFVFGNSILATNKLLHSKMLNSIQSLAY